MFFQGNITPPPLQEILVEFYPKSETYFLAIRTTGKFCWGIFYRHICWRGVGIKCPPPSPIYYLLWFLPYWRGWSRPSTAYPLLAGPGYTRWAGAAYCPRNLQPRYNYFVDFIFNNTSQPQFSIQILLGLG